MTERKVAWVPATTGTALWIAATALLLEDAYRANHWDVQHLAVPILTASTCVAGVLAHKAIARFRLISGAALLVLALLGSGLCVLNTLGRTAADRDGKAATIQAANRNYGLKSDELKAAKVEQAKECKSIGPKCEKWQARVDTLTGELGGISVRSSDPRADAIARLAVLVGLDGERAKEIVRAIEPAALPIFLELGAIVLLGISFPTRRRAIVQVSSTIADSEPAMEKQSFTRAQALRDLRTLREAGSGKMLAERWHVHPATASRWLNEWKGEGAIERLRDGKHVRALIAGPRHT